MFGITTKKRNIINYLMSFQNNCIELLSSVFTDVDNLRDGKLNSNIYYKNMQKYQEIAFKLNHDFVNTLIFNDAYRFHYEKFGKKYKLKYAENLYTAFAVISKHLSDIPTNLVYAFEAYMNDDSEKGGQFIEESSNAFEECNKLFSEIHTILINA